MKRLVVVGNGMAGIACVEQILKHARRDPAIDERFIRWHLIEREICIGEQESLRTDDAAGARTVVDYQRVAPALRQFLREQARKNPPRIAAYPVHEYAGMIFAWMGPLPAPLLPKYDILEHGSGKRYVYGNANNCNWLQTAENAADATHLNWLHAGVYPMYATKTQKIRKSHMPIKL